MSPNRILVCAILVAATAWAQKIPAAKVWTDRGLHDWATPLVGLNDRPGHFSEAEYYNSKPGEWVRTYPVYFPGREPAGYWEELQRKRPEPIITPGSRTHQEWVKAGQIVFRELDVEIFRNYDPAVIAKMRSADEARKLGVIPLRDGTVFGMRWVPTSKGVALSISECAGCHTRVMDDGTYIDGAPVNTDLNQLAGEVISKGSEGFFKESSAMLNWRSFAVPWIKDDIHDRLKTQPPDEERALFTTNITGTFARFNGSPYYPTKMPDLIGIVTRSYIDHTATHRLRGPDDISRYAALVTCCDSADFGPHRMLTDAQRVVITRFPDELLHALSAYIVALEPPPNPHRNSPLIGAGQKVFRREGCATCHTPPLYTNNKLTLAQGFTPAKDHPLAADIMPVSVGTDPALAMKTRKGTGLYKVPSLLGVWYRGLYNHDGSVASLEDWFDAARLRPDYVPTGFVGYGVKSRAVPGHEFGLKLTKGDKAALIAFLKSL